MYSKMGQAIVRAAIANRRIRPRSMPHTRIKRKLKKLRLKDWKHCKGKEYASEYIPIRVNTA